jgi:hypothetical protein
MRKSHTLRMTIALTTALYGLMPTAVMAEYVQIPNPAQTVSPLDNKAACLNAGPRQPGSNVMQSAEKAWACAQLLKPSAKRRVVVPTGCLAIVYQLPPNASAVAMDCSKNNAPQTADGPARQLSY